MALADLAGRIASQAGETSGVRFTMLRGLRTERSGADQIRDPGMFATNPIHSQDA